MRPTRWAAASAIRCFQADVNVLVPPTDISLFIAVENLLADFAIDCEDVFLIISPTALFELLHCILVGDMYPFEVPIAIPSFFFCLKSYYIS